MKDLKTHIEGRVEIEVPVKILDIKRRRVQLQVGDDEPIWFKRAIY